MSTSFLLILLLAELATVFVFCVVRHQGEKRQRLTRQARVLQAHCWNWPPRPVSSWFLADRHCLDKPDCELTAHEQVKAILHGKQNAAKLGAQAEHLVARALATQLPESRVRTGLAVAGESESQVNNLGFQPHLFVHLGQLSGKSA